MRSVFLSMLAGLLVAGLIGCGEDTPEPAKPPAGAATPPEAGAKVPEGTPAANGLDLSFVSDDFFAAVILHPARIAKSPIFAPLLKMEMVAAQMEEIGLQPADVERVMLFMVGPDDEAFRPEPAPGAIVVRLAEPLDVKKRLTELCRTMMGGFEGELIEKTVQGKTCYKIDEMIPMIAFAVDEQTVVITEEERVSGMLSAGPKQGPLATRLGQVDLDADAVAVITLDPIREMIRAGIEEGKDELPPPLAAVAELPDMLAALTLSVDLSGDPLLEAVVEANDAQGAAKVEELVKGALETGKMMFEALKQGVPEEDRAEAAVAMGLADQVLGGFGISRDGPLVTVTLKRPEGLDESLAVMIAQAIEAAREAARRAHQSNNLKWIALAMINHDAAHNGFPAAATRDAEGKPLLSWRVELLPYLEAAPLYEKFKRDEPWDSPHNIQLVEQMPEVFLSVGRANDGKTSIMVFAGEGTAFAGPKGPGFADIKDGPSNTIMCVQAGPDKAVPWTKPEDLPFDPEDPMAALGEVSEAGVQAAFFDGSCRMLPPFLDPETVKGLITPAGGEEVVDW